MNNERRKALKEIQDRINAAVADLEALRDEEQDYFDAMPEGFQQGTKGEAAEEAVQNMDEAIDALTTAVDNIETACNL